jgi:ATP-dependent RNA helicase RhlE
MSFTSLGLSAPILSAVTDKGYDTPSAIQAQAIPAVLEGRDVMAAAQTGTGKTAGFTLPILELLSRGERANANQARALILTPTRELAAQIGENVAMYGKNLPLRSTVVFGGVKINPQMIKLRRGVDILVATPGRLLDLYNQNAVKFNQLEILVLDEADRMLDMGFIHDIRKILAVLPKRRQNLMFSATFSGDIRQLAKGLVNNPVEISVSPEVTTAKSVTQCIYPVDKNQKPALLTHLINSNNWQQVLIFSKTKHGANRLATQLENAGIKAAAIHGNKSQGARTRALAEFKNGDVRALVATDIAARGLDIDQLPQVVNFDLPNVPEDYVHRIGRTGRAGATGHAVSLVCADEFKLLADIERLIKEILPREIPEGFTPVNPLPESRLGAPSNNRPHRPRVEHRDGQRPAANLGARRGRPGGGNRGRSSAPKAS